MSKYSTHEVFIAHSSKDKTVANEICARLESDGICCWIAPRDVTPGASWGEAILEALSVSRVVVIVFSADSNISPQVLREVERAGAKKIPIIPFRIEPIEPTKSMEFFLSTPHWLDAWTPPMEQHIERLLTAVRQFMHAAQDESATVVPSDHAASQGPAYAHVGKSGGVSLLSSANQAPKRRTTLRPGSPQ